MISGVDQFFCGLNGQWSNDTSKILQCEGKLQLRAGKAIEQAKEAQKTGVVV